MLGNKKWFMKLIQENLISKLTALKIKTKTIGLYIKMHHFDVLNDPNCPITAIVTAF